MCQLGVVELVSFSLFLFFDVAIFPISIGVLFSISNRRFDNRNECSSACVAGPSIFIMDDKENAPRMSLAQLQDVVNDDATSNGVIVTGIIGAIIASYMGGDDDFESTCTFSNLLQNEDDFMV